MQFEEAALACLELLRNDGASCVYCDWHDDYVVEEDSQPAYDALVSSHDVVRDEFHGLIEALYRVRS